MADKKYPEYITYRVGDLFTRPPRDIFFRCVDGTLPIYNRVVLGMELINDNKLIIELGELMDDIDADKTRFCSDSSVIALYGEILGVISLDDFDEVDFEPSILDINIDSFMR